MDTNNSKIEKIDGDAPAGAVNSIALLDLYRAGDSRAATELFDRYVARLVGLARSRLSRGMQRRVDPEDVVQSAYRSFFVRAADGDFTLQHSGDLWRLLAQITLNKLRKQAERHTAARRDLRRDGPDAATQQCVEPLPDEAAALVEQVRLITERLSADQRVVLASVLQGDSVDTIAGRLKRSPRTVRRTLAQVKRLVEGQLLDADAARGAAPADVEPLDAPLPYSDFRLERLVGAGGMGKVYRATRLSSGATVAVKALRKDRQREPRAVRQFLNEAAVVQRMSHPGVIRVRGLGRFPSGGYFIVMDYVEGSDLQARIDRERLAPDEALRVVERVAEAVAHAHQAGVVHCDLKPANILLGNHGEVIVTDFGFAQIIADKRPAAALGGTLGYLAPEVLSQAATPTPAADVYSLGALLRRVSDRPGPAAERLCERCLAADPKQRPASVEAFLTILRNCAEDRRPGSAEYTPVT
ncbi:protein kinase domain-containing protein [Pirellulimonas nuda]|uniref:protein kinase domain-containing protein n=1 Tax=Pirellulimonas nuda TaxID=2528009 RepID=UPI0018D2FB81|nr:protein kinase [Pirellulimonas nuda]